ncbi:hypothetical protein FB45DRAFT_1059190 [Roridomyces roridus]|uniref:Uncharacterized protein n=1 Tax=Roridomyces roridus TaxID=1738132 RepID=A0AAD7BQW9_9AGAR|nr:hypothetical protein FB45DRAFT_1059190 [Roridomyces roridus]
MHKNWFTTDKPLGKWSTDWGEWGGLDLFEPPYWEYEEFEQRWNTRIEGILGEITDGPVEPILSLPGDAGEWFLFTAGGRYYFYDDGCLERYRWEYKDKDDFVSRFQEEWRAGGRLEKVERLNTSIRCYYFFTPAPLPKLRTANASILAQRCVSSIRGMRTKPTPRPVFLRSPPPPRPKQLEQTTRSSASLLLPFDYSYIYKDWFTTEKAPGMWSTNWPEWSGITLFAPRKKDSEFQEFSRPWNTQIEGILAELFGIEEGPVEPVLFHPGDAGDWFIFFTGGKYYYYEDGEYLERYGWEYKDKNDCEEEERVGDDVVKIKRRLEEGEEEDEQDEDDY